MAFSKQPSISTYQTKPIRLFDEVDSRDNTTVKDPQYLNVYFEQASKLDKTMHVSKRAGTQVYGPTFSGVRGVHYWEDQNQLLVATGHNLTVIDTTTGTTTTTINNVYPSTTTGHVDFTEFQYDSGVVKVVTTDGVTLSTVDSASVAVACADADMPGHTPYLVYLDGYIFVLKSGTADVYNSNLNDPLAWTAGDFISSEMFPDEVTLVAKLNNYILVMGTQSIEYFWDAGNASGSPLQRNDTPVKLVGLFGCFAQNANKIYFVGKSITGGLDVYELEDFKMKPISNETVRKHLASITSLNTLNGGIVSFDGHEFYVMSADTKTFVYDLSNQTWVQWSFGDSSNLFNVVEAVTFKSSATFCSIIYIESQTQLMKLLPTIYQDNGTNFTCTITTPLQFFDSYNQKFAHRLSVIGDRPATDANLSIQWTDDDYRNYNTAQTVNLNQELPSIHCGGRFRRRAYKLSFTANEKLRINALELDLNLGNA